MTITEYVFDWRNPKINNWRKCQRIVFLHGFNDISVRGLSAQEVAIDLIRKHEKDLTPEELEFVKGLLR